MAANISNFRMPRSSEVPTIGLYLDQTAKYINEVLKPLGCVEITPSMVSNYVKKRYIAKPVKKLYSRDQIMSLMFIALAKRVLSMDNIDLFLKAHPDPVDGRGYDDFCDKFESMLRYVFRCGDKPEDIDKFDDMAERFSISLITAVVHYIYLNDCFNDMEAKAWKE